MAKINPSAYTFEDLDREMNPSFEPIPAGEYLLSANKIEERATRAGEPMYSVQFVVVDGAHVDRRIFTNFFVNVDSEKKFPLLRWAAWAQCVGANEVIDTQDLAQVYRLFQHKVIKAQVRRTSFKKEDGTTIHGNDIQRFIKDLTPREQQIKQSYEAASKTFGGHEGFMQSKPPAHVLHSPPLSTYEDDDIPF